MMAGSTVLLTGAGCFGREADPALHIHRATGNKLWGAMGDRPVRPVGGPFKDYSNAVAAVLDPVTELVDVGVAAVSMGYRPAPGFSAAPLGFADLGSILFYANGVTARREEKTPPLLLRAAPSAGALYASELYVIARNVSELDAGVYYYDVRDHTLARTGDVPTDEFLSDALDLGPGALHAPAYVAISNVFDRYEWKYANRGYRYALVDTGHIGENLRLSATVLHVRERPVSRFIDDRLNAALAIDGKRESVCALHALGHTEDETPGWIVGDGLVEKGEARGLFGGWKGRATRRFHAATKLHRGEQTVDAPPPASSVTVRQDEQVIELPRAAPASFASLGQAIKRRRSPLGFAQSPIEQAQLATLFLTMRDRITADVTPYVIVNEVEGLARGLYRYEAAKNRLTLIEARDLRDAFAEACLGQDKARSASVGVLMVGALGRAMERDGRRAYRDVLITAGELGQLVYLAAESLGLGARNLAAFRDDPLNALLGLDGEQIAVVHLTMFGHSA